MGLWKQLLETAGEKITKDKDQREREEAFVRNNEGSKAICEFMVSLFEKGNSGYNWVKENRRGLYPVMYPDAVALCYMQPGDGQSFSGMKTKDMEVKRYTFEEIYRWYGLEQHRGFGRLNSRTQLNALETMINNEVQKLPHIKYNIGFVVKMFH